MHDEDLINTAVIALVGEADATAAIATIINGRGCPQAMLQSHGSNPSALGFCAACSFSSEFKSVVAGSNLSGQGP